MTKMTETEFSFLAPFQSFVRENRILRRIDFDLVLVLSIPFILLAANQEWLFPYGNPSDAWINVKFFFDTGHEYPFLYTIYKATRLSWIIKGFLAHQLFPPLAAHYILHLTMFLAYVAVFYLIVRDLMNRHVAVVATIAFATYSQLHAVISFEWDYQIHDGVVNILLTLLLLLFATKRPRWRLWLVLAGAAWASALQTTMMGTFVPAVVFWYLYLNHKHERRPILVSAVYIFAGAVAVTLLYGVASYLLGGPFFFFLNQIATFAAFGFVGGFNFHPGYWFPFTYLLQFSKGLVFPMFVAAISAVVLAVVLIRGHKGSTRDSIVLVIVTLLICAVISIAFHMIGHGLLSNDHILAYSSPFVFLAIAGVYGYFLRLSGITVPANVAKSWALKIAVLVIFCGALIFGRNILPQTAALVGFMQDLLGFPDRFLSWQSISALMLLLLFAAAAVVTGMALRWDHRSRAYIGVVALSGFLAAVNVQNTSIDISSYDARFDRKHREDQYLAIIDAHLKIKKFDPNHDLRLWYRNNENPTHSGSRCQNVRISMTALYGGILGIRGFTVIPDRLHLLESYLSTRSFSELSKRSPSRLPPQFRTAILAKDPVDHKIALKTLASFGFKTKVLDRSHVQHGVIAFDITILDVRKDARLKALSRQ